MRGTPVTDHRPLVGRLVADGLVEFEDNRGYRVAPVSLANLREVTQPLPVCPRADGARFGRVAAMMLAALPSGTAPSVEVAMAPSTAPEPHARRVFAATQALFEDCRRIGAASGEDQG